MKKAFQILRRRRRLALALLVLSTVVFCTGSLGRAVLGAETWSLVDLLLLLLSAGGVAGQLLALLALSGKPQS